MKCNLRPSLTNRQRKTLECEAEKQIQAQTEQIVRRWMKLTCVALNERYGFGVGRLGNLLVEITRLSELADTDEEYWTHIDRRLQQLGFVFEEE